MPPPSSSWRICSGPPFGRSETTGPFDWERTLLCSNSRCTAHCPVHRSRLNARRFSLLLCQCLRGPSTPAPILMGGVLVPLLAQQHHGVTVATALLCPWNSRRDEPDLLLVSRRSRLGSRARRVRVVGYCLLSRRTTTSTTTTHAYANNADHTAGDPTSFRAYLSPSRAPQCFLFHGTNFHDYADRAGHLCE